MPTDVSLRFVISKIGCLLEISSTMANSEPCSTYQEDMAKAGQAAPRPGAPAAPAAARAWVFILLACKVLLVDSYSY